MTVKSDLEKAVAQAQAALGTYATFATSTEDQTAKQLFQQMERDMRRHVDMLNSRLDYINSNNNLNQKQDEQGNQ